MIEQEKGTLATIRERLKRILVAELNLEEFTPEAIDDDEPLFGGRLGLDSVDALEIVYQVEQNFGVPMKEMNEARAAFQSISTLAAYIAARQKG